MPNAPYRYQHRVTYAECTVGNHIYHSRYLDLLEAARGEFLRHLGPTVLQLQAADRVFPVIECRVRYKAMARYDDLLEIEVWPTAVERIRLNFAHRVIRPATGTLLLEAETFHVCTNVAEKPKRIPEEMATLLLQWLGPGFPE